MNWLTEAMARNPVPPPLELPVRFQNASVLEIPIEGRLRVKAIAYLANFWDIAPEGRGMLLIGKAGTYKTYTAAAVIRRIWEANVDSLFVQCPITLNAMERNRFSEETTEQIKRMETVPFLVMDDFSQIAPNTFGARVMLEIAESRFSNLHPTIWTGNIAVEQPSAVREALGNLYGASFGRRLIEPNEGYSVYVRS